MLKHIFAAHVIGFDISNPQGKAELQCLAEQTGGTFRTARNAAELADALQVVTEPEPVGVGFAVLEKGSDKFIQDQLIWTLTYEGRTLIDTLPHENSFGMEFLLGKGHVEVMRPEDEAFAELDFTVTDKAEKVYLELPKLLPQALIDAPSEAPAGSEIMVNWSGPEKSGDIIALVNPQDGVAEGVANGNNYFYVEQNANHTAQMRVFTTPGTYELRYQTSTGNGDILVRKMIKITEFAFDITAPDKMPVGTVFDEEWKSPTNKGYIISLAKPDDSSNDHITYLYADQYPSPKATMTAPTKPGTYELHYVQKGNERKILAAVPLDVVPMTASLQAADTATRDDTVQVTWEGPAHRRDTITIAKPGSDSAEAFASVAGGSPATLYAPMVTGDYEIRYIYGPLNKVLATIPLKVE